ncbi:MAG: glycoside hydrolase family 3 protein [Spirochaetaceae bacterium]|jgi:beta-N-acetylhexosaminidase|nr:glycoside hydrolase family 3 protein [Spirochaetaceae bacterium]
MQIAFPTKILPAALTVVWLLTSAAAGALNFYDDVPAPELAGQIVGAMTDEEALAQIYMFGWKDWIRGPEPNIEEWITRRSIGGVKVFGWNTGDIEQLARTIGDFQKLAGSGRFSVPLLVATDQEGGTVRHVKDRTSETPSAMAQGASGFPEDAYRSGWYVGKELAVLGINMNFAPMVDLYTNHDSTLIGPRSFGDDPVKTGLLGIAFAKGQEKSGVISTAKHFPGHGDTALDSHGTLPRIGVDFETLWERELVPYRMLAKDGIPAIMSGHLAFPRTEAGDEPASLSPWFLQTVLREKIGYTGLIVTDDLAMNGATVRTGTLSQAAKAAVIAGNDLVMLSHTPAPDEPIWTSLLQEMRVNTDFQARVRDAARRVLLVKLRFLKGQNAVPLQPDIGAVRTGLSDAEGKEFFLDVAARSVTLIGAKEGLIPLDGAKAAGVLLCYPPERNPQKKLPDFFVAGRRAYPEAPRIWYDHNNLGQLFSFAADADTIIFYLRDREEIAVLNSLRRFGKRVIVFSGENPSYLQSLSWVDCAIALYNNTYESHIAAFSALRGSLKPIGALPFKQDF